MTAKKLRIGILTGGGDAPGLNGILEAAGRSLLRAGVEVLGIEDGFEGIFYDRHRLLSLADLTNIHSEAGTLLGTSNKCGTAGRESEFLEKYRKLGLSGLIVAGGDGTFSGLKSFAREIPVIGVPKTIDNDLAGTEITFGFDTACAVVSEAVDALRATANAHRRVIVVETMGRTAGWIALGGGLASYADVILIPERPYSPEKLLQFIRDRQTSAEAAHLAARGGHSARVQRGRLVVVSEGAAAQGGSATIAFSVAGSPQAERYGGVAQNLAKWIEKESKWEARTVVLGHLQRARQPTTTDRFLTLAMGVEVSRMVRDQAWGQAAVFRDGKVTRAPIDDLMKPARLVDPDHRWVKLAEALGIFV